MRPSRKPAQRSPPPTTTTARDLPVCQVVLLDAPLLHRSALAKASFRILIVFTVFFIYFTVTVAAV